MVKDFLRFDGVPSTEIDFRVGRSPVLRFGDVVVTDPPEVPETIPSLQVWYDFSNPDSYVTSGGIVTQFVDLSGNGIDMTAANPATAGAAISTADSSFNNLDVLQINNSSGNKTFETGTITPIAPAFVMLVIRRSAFAFLSLFTPFGGASLYNATAFETSGPGFHEASGAFVLPLNVFVNGEELQSTQYQEGLPATYGGANEWPTDINDAQLVAFTTNPRNGTGTPGVTTDDSFTLQQTGLDISFWIGEMIVLNAVPTASERITLENYLLNKWGLTRAGIPANALLINGEALTIDSEIVTIT